MTTHQAGLGWAVHPGGILGREPQGGSGVRSIPCACRTPCPGAGSTLAVPRWSVGGNLGSLAVALDEWAVEFGEIIKEPDSHNAPGNK